MATNCKRKLKKAIISTFLALSILTSFSLSPLLSIPTQAAAALPAVFEGWEPFAIVLSWLGVTVGSKSDAVMLKDRYKIELDLKIKAAESTGVGLAELYREAIDLGFYELVPKDVLERYAEQVASLSPVHEYIYVHCKEGDIVEAPVRDTVNITIGMFTRIKNWFSSMTSTVETVVDDYFGNKQRVKLELPGNNLNSDNFARFLATNYTTGTKGINDLLSYVSDSDLEQLNSKFGEKFLVILWPNSTGTVQNNFNNLYAMYIQDIPDNATTVYTKPGSTSDSKKLWYDVDGAPYALGAANISSFLIYRNKLTDTPTYMFDKEMYRYDMFSSHNTSTYNGNRVKMLGEVMNTETKSNCGYTLFSNAYSGTGSLYTFLVGTHLDSDVATYAPTLDFENLPAVPGSTQTSNKHNVILYPSGITADGLGNILDPESQQEEDKQVAIPPLVDVHGSLPETGVSDDPNTDEGLNVLNPALPDLLDKTQREWLTLDQSKDIPIDLDLILNPSGDEDPDGKEGFGSLLGSIFNFFWFLLLVLIALIDIFICVLNFAAAIFVIPAKPVFMNEGMLQGLGWLKTTEIVGFGISIWDFMMLLVTIMLIFFVIKQLRHNIDRIRL